MGKSMGGFTTQMTQMSRKRAASPSKRGSEKAGLLDDTPPDKKQNLETSVPVSMHGLHTEHTAADKHSEHTEEEESENQSADFASEGSNTTEIVHDFNQLKFETKTTEQDPDQDGN